MVLTLKTPLKHAEKWKNYLVQKDLMDKEYRPFKEKDFLYFPLKKKFRIASKEISFVQKQLEQSAQSKSLREQLKDTLTTSEMNLLQTAHDIIGTIAILEIPQELEKKEKLIAKTLLDNNKNVHTVLKKAAAHQGVFRTQKLKYLIGKKTKETVYKENGVMIKLDVEKVYFSPRLSNERLRIAQQVKKNENVLVMFSGAAPYPLVIAKLAEPKQILGIEINPQGHKYGLENVKLNKFKNIDLICGDVKKIIPQLQKKNSRLTFDRIIMPLPKTADEFLDTTLSVARKGTIIHFYDFLAEDAFDEAVQKIDVACTRNHMKYRILKIVKCGQHAPHVFRVCVDFRVC
jgi:tRNA (guanine37-N1)-methyltransferase